MEEPSIDQLLHHLEQYVWQVCNYICVTNKLTIIRYYTKMYLKQKSTNHGTDAALVIQRWVCSIISELNLKSQPNKGCD